MKNPLNVYKYLPFLLRRRFKSKYIVIESDDWGLEMSLEEDGLKHLKSVYGEANFTRWSTDALETAEDLARLYDILDKYRNKFEKKPVITANFITHNIDYRRPDKLSFIPISEGFNPESQDVREMYRNGVKLGLIFPQLHGFSHYNVTKLVGYFLTEEGARAFSAKFFTGKSTIRGNLPVFRGELSVHNSQAQSQIKQSQGVFRALFGYESESIIPPAFILDPALLGALESAGIKAVQACNRLIDSNGKHSRKIYFRESKDLVWAPRVARLDPHPDYQFFFDHCLANIQASFNNRSPAIIDFHRVNISGKYAASYRDRSLNELDQLLASAHRLWPEVKFITTQEMIDLCLQ